MNHIYLGLSLSLICLFLAYFILSKFLLVTLLCVILAGSYFKDDFTVFRYIAARVASFYSWICDLFSGIQSMYHQSNNTNFPVRKCIAHNGTVSRKFERLSHGSTYNLSTSYVTEKQPSNSGIWGSGSKFSSPNSFSNRTQSTLQEMSKLNITHRGIGENSTSDQYSIPNRPTPSGSPLKIAHATYSRSADSWRSGSSANLATLNHPSNLENKPPLNAKLYADVSSPGFCGRVADRLSGEVMTHQPKYDTVGAFPVVNLKSQSPKIKIKTPVRVRLAPPTSEIMHYNYGANTMTRSPMLGPDDSMKSVLQVLKEISRKRIHSHVDEESEEGSKRLRVTDNDGLLHTSLLQQTIQGKRAREETSPNEDDKKRRKASMKNNEILSSLSSSLSVRPPHLQTTKRKAQSIDDSITTTPVLGKLLKVQSEVTPPTPTNHITAPAVCDATSSEFQEFIEKTCPSPGVPSPIAPPPVVAEAVSEKETSAAQKIDTDSPETDEDGAVSRLLGRMSDQTTYSAPVPIPAKKNVFMSTNDLSLSPPKENRLAAMIAVLGGPSEQSELESNQSEVSKQPERMIKGKALFMTPETPAQETPKQTKKVTFSDSLTTTKIFERDELDNGNSAGGNQPLGPSSTPLSSAAFSSAANTTPTGPKLNFGFGNASTAKPSALNFDSSPMPSSKEAAKPSESGSFAMNTSTTSATSMVSASLGSQTPMFQVQPSSLSLTSAVSSASSSGLTFPLTGQVSNSINLTNAPSTGGFSFGSNSSLVNPGKESPSKQTTDSPSVKPFSFGTESKTSQPASSVAGFPSLFPTAASKNENVKASEVVSAAGQNKPMFNIFGNKDPSSSFRNNEGENKPLVNGFTSTTSSSSPFALSHSVSQESSSKPLIPSFTANTNPNATTQAAPTFSFGSTTSATASTTHQTTSSAFTGATQQANLTNVPSFQPNSLSNAAASPSLNMFSSSTSSPAQAKQSPFGSGVQGTSAFGESVFKPVSSSNHTSQANPVFGSTPLSGFGITHALQNGAISSTSGASQSNNMFGNVSSNSAGKVVMFGGEQNTMTQPSTQPAFGFPGTPVTTQTGSPFGLQVNNAISSTPSIFGSTTTSAQSTPMFGSGTPNIGSQSSSFPTPSTTAGQQSLFGSIAANDASKNMFSGASNTNPTFGGSGSISSPSFGTQSNPPPAFGAQISTSAPTFGNQSAPAFTFGSQSTGSNPSQGGFRMTGSFSGGPSNISSNEVKPQVFGSASPFMFGNSSASKPTEAVKPLGTAKPFAFGSSGQQSSSANSAQPSVPSFGTPAPTFGASQPAPTFGGSTSQPAAPTFQFGQPSSSTAPAFQFSAAAPPAVGGGMFSIGSGGSSTPRSKTIAFRRSHKRT